MADDPHFHELAPRTLIRDQVFERLAGDIASGRLQPLEEIRDVDLQAEYGVSRTPIREAIIRLADLGLIQLSSYRYTRVAPIDLGAQLERSEAAHALVGHAALRLASRITDEELLEIHHRLGAVLDFDGGNYASHEGLVLWFDFYDSVVRPARSAVIYTMFREQLGLHLLRSVLATRLPDQLVEYLRGYAFNLYEALRERDGRRARDHVVDAFDVAVKPALMAAMALDASGSQGGSLIDGIGSGVVSQTLRRGDDDA